jgi:hypothetical protein
MRRSRCSQAIFLTLAFAVLASTLAAQTWSSPQFVANGLGIGVATNGAGTSAVLFIPSSSVLQASVKTGSTWSTPVTLSSLGPYNNGTGRIAVAPNGDVLAVWAFRTTNTYLPGEAQARFFTNGQWGNTITLSTSVYGNVYSFGLPSIGFDSHSQATVVWEQFTNPTAPVCGLLAATGNATSGFGTARTISTATTCYGRNQLAVASDGQAVVVEGAAGILSADIPSISRSATGAWSAPVTIAAYSYRQNQPNVGLGNDGTAVVVWRTRSGVGYSVRSNGTWSPAATLPQLTGQAGGATSVAVDGSGNAVAAFQQVTISPGIYATYRPVGGTWQTKTQLSSGTQLAATPAGTFVDGGSTVVSTRLAGTSNWNTTTFSGSALVNAAPGQAIALIGPQVSVSTASVP